MKKAAILLSLLFCFCLMVPAKAQLSRKEKKEWKKQMKRMEVEEFKNLVEEKQSLEGEVSQLSSQVSGLEAQLNEKANTVERLQAELRDAQNQLDETQAMLTKLQQDDSMDISRQGNQTRVAKGVVFKVQIGAFRNKDLSKYFDKAGSFDGEVDNSLERYTLGIFEDYWEADKFKKYLRDMGVKDAWVVAYKDGQRVPLKDVLEGVI